MLIVSWNVAGWEPTLRYIKLHYKTLEAFLDRHSIDILCLQEVKVPRAKLASDPAAVGAHTPGWESFWSWNSTAKRGFNGVTTFVRKGLIVRATGQPLNEKTLDGEGRAVLTDHGSFVVFNVYAHAAYDDPEGTKKAIKLRFLAAVIHSNHSHNATPVSDHAKRACAFVVTSSYTVSMYLPAPTCQIPLAGS